MWPGDRHDARSPDRAGSSLLAGGAPDRVGAHELPEDDPAAGGTFSGITLYIAFGVWTVLVVATMTAVANVPDRYIERARTLGASRRYTYYRVIVPASIPEMRSALLLAMGGGWSLAIAAEFLGYSSGLGYLADAAVPHTNFVRQLIQEAGRNHSSAATPTWPIPERIAVGVFRAAWWRRQFNASTTNPLERSRSANGVTCWCRCV